MQPCQHPVQQLGQPHQEVRPFGIPQQLLRLRLQVAPGFQLALRRRPGGAFRPKIGVEIGLGAGQGGDRRALHHHRVQLVGQGPLVFPRLMHLHERTARDQVPHLRGVGQRVAGGEQQMTCRIPQGEGQHLPHPQAVGGELDEFHGGAGTCQGRSAGLPLPGRVPFVPKLSLW